VSYEIDVTYRTEGDSREFLKERVSEDCLPGKVLEDIKGWFPVD